MVKQFWSWRYAKFAHRCSKFPADMLPPVTPKPQACQTRVKFVNRAKPVVHVVWRQQCDFFSLSFGCLLACLLVCLLFVCVCVYVLWLVGFCFMLFSFCSWLLFSLLIKQGGNTSKLLYTVTNAASVKVYISALSSETVSHFESPGAELDELTQQQSPPGSGQIQSPMKASETGQV